MSDLQKLALELRKAIQLFAASLDADTQADMILEIPSVVKDVFSYGLNSVGDPQLYQVLQAHTSAEQWPPDSASGLYKKIGISDSGYPEWVRPLGATDAYNTGDIVSYNGTLYRSVIDANVWSPDEYPAGWEVYTP